MTIPSNLVACPRCAAQPGEFCVERRDHPLDDPVPVAFVHAERVEAAQFISGELDKGNNVAITDEAILGTGLV